MRLVAIFVLASGFLALPASGQAQPDRGQCRALTKQIANFEGDVARARERGNQLWENASRKHIAGLTERRAERCPQYARSDGAARRFASMLGKAARTAARYFTFGN